MVCGPPVSLPWLTVTLMDFDCGKTPGACERVESADHARHEANFVKELTEGHLQERSLRLNLTQHAKTSQFCGIARIGRLIALS